jgi:hypothetical protein
VLPLPPFESGGYNPSRIAFGRSSPGSVLGGGFRRNSHHLAGFRAMATESQIPVGSQFSPSLISLPALTAAIVACSGNRDALLDAINRPPVRQGARAPETRRNRSLPVEAAVQYGLLEPESLAVTAFGRSLAALPEREQFEAFARHILLNLGGLRVVQGTEEMIAEGQKITGDTLARHLTAQGFFVAEHNTAINTLRMWLAQAGVFSLSGKGAAAWKPDRRAIEELVGLDKAGMEALAAFTPEQKAFAIALARRNPTAGEWIPAADLRDAAEGVSGLRMSRSSLPNAVLRPLESAGLINFKSGGTKAGKTSLLAVTEKFNADVLEPFLQRTCDLLDPSLVDYFRRRPADIRAAIDSSSKNVAGQALEAFAIQVMRTLGLTFDSWQRRAVDTAWGEVDVLMSGVIGCVPTRWQLQCKNTKQTVSHEVLARELGLRESTRATHILVMTRGRFSTNAINFATTTMRTSRMPIFLVDGNAFENLLEEPSRLAAELRQQSQKMTELLRRS